MPLIVYRGHTPVVSVPAHQLAEVEHGVPVEVPQHVADDLTLGGASPVWQLATPEEAAAHAKATAAAAKASAVDVPKGA